MPSYRNGEVPTNLMVKFASGKNGYNGEATWEHLLPPATYKRHKALITRAHKRTGKVLQIRPGYNAYRPLWVQRLARAKYGNGAATPGTSSHGGFWEGIQCMAMDYGNWGDVYGWDRGKFYADARAVGLTPGLISTGRGYPDEPWHVIDKNPWGAVPSGLDVSYFEEDELSAKAEKQIQELHDALRRGIAGKRSEGKTTAWIRSIKSTTEAIRATQATNTAAIKALAASVGADPQEIADIVAAAVANVTVESTLSAEQIEAVAARIAEAVELPDLDYDAIADAVNDDAAARLTE